MKIKDRILNMRAIPIFERTTIHGEIEITEPDWDLPIEVTIEYYDGRLSKCIASNKEELSILNLYHRKNMEYWANDEEYD